MNLQYYMKKLESSDVFKDFIKENPNAYFCSGFFTIDIEGHDNQRHIDFYSPDKKRRFGFIFNNKIELMPLEDIENETPPKKIDSDMDFDFEEIKRIIGEEISARNIKSKLQKIIISLQQVNKNPTLLCTAFTSMFGLIKVEIDPISKKITFFEKKSFFDFMKLVK